MFSPATTTWNDDTTQLTANIERKNSDIESSSEGGRKVSKNGRPSGMNVELGLSVTNVAPPCDKGFFNSRNL